MSRKEKIEFGKATFRSSNYYSDISGWTTVVTIASQDGKTVGAPDAHYSRIKSIKIILELEDE